jgi:hypothetical protein
MSADPDGTQMVTRQMAFSQVENYEGEKLANRRVENAKRRIGQIK